MPALQLALQILRKPFTVEFSVTVLLCERIKRNRILQRLHHRGTENAEKQTHARSGERKPLACAVSAAGRTAADVL